MFCNIWHPLVERAGQRPHRIDMIMRTCSMPQSTLAASRGIIHTSQNRSSAWSTDRIGNIAMIEQHSFFRKPIQVRSLVDTCSVCSNGFRCVVVCHDEQNVGLRAGWHSRYFADHFDESQSRTLWKCVFLMIFTGGTRGGC